MIDLHIHSTVSDGTYTPAALVKLAEKCNVSVIALTDHDTISGLKEFATALKNSKVIGIPGVEVAVSIEKSECHILGYWVNNDCDRLNKLLEEIRKNRNKRNLNIINVLQKSGIKITLNDIIEQAKSESIGRPHIASVLVKKGYFKTIRDVFSYCLARGNYGYVPRKISEAKTVIDAIHSAGGITFWAHPLHRARTNNDILFQLKYLLKLGLDGIEAYYSEYTSHQQKILLDHAKNLNIPVCGGTDFHGKNLADILLGRGRGNLKVPEKVYFDLLEYYKKDHRLPQI